MLSVPELAQGKPVISLSINPPLKAQFVSSISPSQSMFIPFGRYPRRVFHISLLYIYIYTCACTYIPIVAHATSRRFLLTDVALRGGLVTMGHYRMEPILHCEDRPDFNQETRGFLRRHALGDRLLWWGFYSLVFLGDFDNP